MKITYDSAKRQKTLIDREVDFEDAALIFSGRTLTFEDDRRDYGEPRYVTVGLLDGRMIILIWTPRGDVRHIISMRKANEREQIKYKDRLV